MSNARVLPVALAKRVIESAEHRYELAKAEAMHRNVDVGKGVTAVLIGGSAAQAHILESTKGSIAQRVPSTKDADIIVSDESLKIIARDHYATIKSHPLIERHLERYSGDREAVHQRLPIHLISSE
jgi:hypothetical protein